MFTRLRIFTLSLLATLGVAQAIIDKPDANSFNRALQLFSGRNLQPQCSLEEVSLGDTPECASIQPTEDFDLCFGVRGNGPRLFAHFPALARAVEEFGIPSAYVGSSSATITGFLFESILENPLIKDCDGRCCSGME